MPPLKPALRKQFRIVDDETGEITEAYGLVVPKRTPHPYGDDGIQIRQSMLRVIAENRHLSKKALRIILWLLGNLDRDGKIHTLRKSISHDLQLDKSEITRGLRELHSLNGQSDPITKVVYPPILPPGDVQIGVRPSVAWRGTAKDLWQALKDEKEAQNAGPRIVKKRPARQESLPPEQRRQIIVEIVAEITSTTPSATKEDIRQALAKRVPAIKLSEATLSGDLKALRAPDNPKLAWQRIAGKDKGKLLAFTITDDAEQNTPEHKEQTA